MTRLIPRSDLARRWREDVPRVIPAWLTEARDHLREHYPHDGLSESCLWGLDAAGFDLPKAPDSNEDLLEPLRKVVCP